MNQTGRNQTNWLIDLWVSDYGWQGNACDIKGFPEIRLQAAYVDGHVEPYYPSDTERMQASITSDGYQPYPSMTGPGDIFIPSSQTHRSHDNPFIP
jgi:prepilin-type processing-associated H-X9-DG protein